MTPIRIPGGRKVGALAIAATLVASAEGLRTQAYLDPVKIPTLCFGETRGVKLGDTATPEQCQAMLKGRLAEFSDGVDKCLTRPVPDESYAAFLSLAYNTGLGNFCSSTLVKKANAGDVRGACYELSKWDKVRISGVLTPLPGLTNRRKVELTHCLNGVATVGGL